MITILRANQRNDDKPGRLRSYVRDESTSVDEECVVNEIRMFIIKVIGTDVRKTPKRHNASIVSV